MGKPFESELKKLKTTYQWASQQSVDEIWEELFTNNNKPMFIVGSGGSLSACHYLASLYQEKGMMAKAITPLELFYSKQALRESNVFFLSASGRNTDILFGYTTAINYEPNKIYSLCMTQNNPLSKLASSISISKIFEFNLPTGKDGFLATNSLMAFFTILCKAFSKHDILKKWDEENLKEYQTNLDFFINQINQDFTFLVLYGGWGQPIAIDIESKLAEAALADVLLSDYRNFGHGRHHWLDKRKKTAAIIALITPSEEQIAFKTLALLPPDIPILKITSNSNNAFAAIELLTKAFYFIKTLGEIQGIDPGQPGVPDFGSKLYHLNYKKLYTANDKQITIAERIAIVRKANVSSYEALNEIDKFYWTNAYNTFVGRLQSAEFGSVIFDYDGTICSTEERYVGVNPEIVPYLNKFLEMGLIIGVATGRGKSVREKLQGVIPKKFWNQVMIGYYSCSDFGLLGDNQLPDKELKQNTSLQIIFNALTEHEFIVKLKPELKPHQIIIEINDKKEWSKVRLSIIEYIVSLNISNIQILESSHSLDIIDQRVTNKLNIINKCVELASKKSLSEYCLCIGDKGKWPGNDYQLLTSDYSLSVDEVSSVKNTCWNLAKPGIKNTQATIYYLSCLSFKKKGLIMKIS